MENQNTFLYGNEKLLNFFSSASEKGKLAHAYIFEGGRGSGKHTLARRLSCLIACRSLFDRPCFMCESCRKISEGISPDVIEVSLLNDKKSIGVEQIRELRSSVYVKPSEEDVKVYIITNAEAMTEPAQNVFLKVLEEPPMGVFFLLLCENSSNILPTVKSRAPVLKMQIFSDSELSDYLLNNDSSAKALYASSREEFELIVRMAEGKIGEAKRLLSDAKSDRARTKHEKAKQMIELLGESKNASEIVCFMLNSVKKRDELADLLLYSMYAVRDIMAVKKCSFENVPLLFYNDYDYVAELASKFTAAAIMTIYDELCRTRFEVYGNANLNNTLVYLASELKKAANI